MKTNFRVILVIFPATTKADARKMSFQTLKALLFLEEAKVLATKNFSRF